MYSRCTLALVRVFYAHPLITSLAHSRTITEAGLPRPLGLADPPRPGRGRSEVWPRATGVSSSASSSAGASGTEAVRSHDGAYSRPGVLPSRTAGSAARSRWRSGGGDRDGH